jgi:hypothetical protein
MAIATVEQIRTRIVGERDREEKQEMLRQLWAYGGPNRNLYGFYGETMPQTFRYSQTLAEEFLAYTKSQWDMHALGKGPRPWNIARVTDDLDKSQPWVGIEYETGFRNHTAYLDGVNELWNNHNNVVMDGEGYGSYYAEITFSPVALSDFNTDQYNVDRLMAVDQERGLLMPYTRDQGTWGMHVNFSTPAIRTNADLASKYADLLCNSQQHMTIEQRTECFGRNPYGQFEYRDDGNTGLGWIEGKLFQTTTDPAAWANYKRVINNLINVVLRIESRMEGLDCYNNCITNFTELLLASDVDDVEIEVGPTRSNGGPSYGNMDFEYEDDDEESSCSCLGCRMARGEI